MSRRRPPLPPPETGVVAALNSDGAGVVRGDVKTAFVPGALPGETIHFQRRHLHKGYDDALLIEVIQPSPERVEPKCVHFNLCGGCSLQHLAHASQVRAKDRELRDAVERLGQVQPEAWAEPLTGPIWGYRRRARLGARYVTQKERVLVGFRERNSSLVADISGCEVLVPQVGRLIAALSQLVQGLSIRSRVPQVEVAAADNQTVLVLRVLDPPTVADREALAAFEREHAVRFRLQAGAPNDLESLDGHDEPLFYELPEFDIRLRFLPSDFVQVNGPMNQRMVSHVIGLLGLDAQSRVLDLFCGLGNFTLPLARRAAEVVGIEGEEGLVQRARDNASENGLANLRFHAANLAGDEAAEACLRLAGPAPFSHVLLDPPRTGARDVLAAVAKLAPRRVVYVSCHPGSLARDLGILVGEHGFRLRSAGIVDMFPHTNHVESVAVLDGPGG
jgi:23S rRNA (uracil1939-C5)-methyltransferase